MSKRIASVFLFLSLFTLAKAQDSSQYNLLWRVSGNGLTQPSYLFGTMHVRDARAFNFSDSVMLALESCDAFAMEAHPDSFLKAFFPSVAETVLSKAMDKAFEEEMEEEGDEAELEKTEITPAAPSVQPMDLQKIMRAKVSRPDDKETFVDAYLMGVAKTLNKEILGLEPINAQVDLLTSWLLEKPVLTKREKFDDSLGFYDRFVLAYSEGNLTNMKKLVTHEFVMGERMVSRNQVMANSMHTIMQNQRLFAAVGAAHLMGEKSVIALLKDMGYQLSPVDASFKGVANRYSIEPSEFEWVKHENQELGYSIKMPSDPLSIPFQNIMKIDLSMDIATGTYYMVMAVDMRHSTTEIDGQAMTQRMLARMNDKNLEKLTQREIEKDGSKGVEVAFRHPSQLNEQINIQLFVKDKIAYLLMMGGSDETIKSNQSNRFFDSFESFEVAIPEAAPWVVHTEDQGAYSVKFPTLPKPMDSEIPNPDDPTGVPYKLYGKLCINVPTTTNYYVFYNDMPNGYYLYSTSTLFTGLEEELSETAEFIGEPDTIWLDGNEGREYAMKLNGMFYTKMRVYVRGNRVYKVFKQSFNASSNSLSEDGFFESFSFTPYENPEPEYYVSKDGTFQLKLFSSVKEDVTEYHDHEFEYDKITTLYSANSNSGGLYMLEYYDFKEYLCIESINDYCAQLIENAREWSDSLVSIDSVSVGEYDGREYRFQDRFSGKKKIGRTWIAGNRCYMFTTYLSEEELESEMPQLIFNSFKTKGETAQSDLYSSKVLEILNNLSSEDTAVANAAIGAFSYHYFSEKDTTALLSAMWQPRTDDTSQNGSRCHIITALGSVYSNTRTYEKLYKAESSTDVMRYSILTALLAGQKESGNELFAKLLTHHAPVGIENTWPLFRPFKDSLDLADKYFEELLSLLPDRNYKSQLLSLAVKMSENQESNSLPTLKKHWATLTAHIWKDLDSFIAQKGSFSGDSWDYYTYVSHYLDLFTHVGETDETDRFTNRLILDDSVNIYLKGMAAQARVQNGLFLNKKVKKQLLNSDDIRYDLLRVYSSANRLGEIPRRYLKPEKLVIPKLQDYLYYSDEYPEKMKVIGSIRQGDSLIYVCSFQSEYDSDPPANGYIALVGSFKHNESNTVPYLKGYSNWKPLNTEWKNQAINLIEDFDKHGY